MSTEAKVRARSQRLRRMFYTWEAMISTRTGRLTSRSEGFCERRKSVGEVAAHRKDRVSGALREFSVDKDRRGFVSLWLFDHVQEKPTFSKANEGSDAHHMWNFLDWHATSQRYAAVYRTGSASPW